MENGKTCNGPRGFVFKEVDGSVLLLQIMPNLVVQEQIISDYSDIYETLPTQSADIVEVDEDPEKQMVILKSICGLSFSAHGTNCPAREAIRETAAKEPAKLVEVLESAEYAT